MKRIYSLANDARHFQLELDIAEFSQGTCTIQEYYSHFMNLWMEYTTLALATVPDAALSALQTFHATTQWHQFLMKLRREFEPIQVGLMNHVPVPDLDTCLQELLREEQRFASQTLIDTKKGVPGTSEVAFVAQSKNKTHGISKIHCYS